MLRAIRSCDVPVIAAVDGWAVGLGVGIAGAASHAVAGEGARFTMPEAAMGFFPYAVAPYLVDRVRPETVLAWALSGRRFGAEEALASGLITEVCAAGEAETVATELAAALATAPRGVVEQATEWLRRYRTPVDPDETFVSWCEHRMAGVHAAGVKTSREEQ
jgi:enoyl-CoA hydratase/carnithine racemase